MAIISFTREEILAAPLDEEEHALLLAQVEMDLIGKHHFDKYVRPLLAARISQIREDRAGLGLPPLDVIGNAEAEEELRSEIGGMI